MAVRRTGATDSRVSNQGPAGITVRQGDTLGALARRHGVTLQQLLDANPSITDPNRIVAGQHLRLPPAPSTAPTSSPRPAPRPTTSGPGVDRAPTAERRALGRDPATVQPELNSTGTLRGNGTLGLLSARRELERGAGQPAAAPVDRPHSWNPLGTVDDRLSESMQGLSPTSLRGVDGLQLAGAVKDGDLQVEIPLRAGRYRARGVSFEIEPNTVMRVQMQVRDGKLVPARDARGRDTGGGCKVEIDPPADLPLWLTGRGAYLRDRGQAQAQFKADIGGFFDLNISGRGSLEVQDLIAGFADGNHARDARPPARRERAEQAPLPEGLLQLDRMRFTAGRVTLKDSVLDAGSARIDLAPGSELRLSGSAAHAELSGRVRVDGIALRQDGQALRTGAGETEVTVRSSARPDGTVQLSTRLHGLEAEVQGLELSRPGAGEGPPDRLSLGPTRVRSGEVRIETLLRPGAGGATPTVAGGSVATALDVEGQLNGLQLRVPDGQGTASIAVGPSRFRGTLQTGPEGTRVQGTLDDVQLEARDLQDRRQHAGINVEHLRVRGRAELRLDTTSDDYQVDVQARALDLRVDDYRGEGGGTAIDLGRTEITGSGRVQVGRQSGLQLDGDLHLRGEIDDIQVQRRDGSTGLDVARGSRVDARVSHLAAGGGRGFELDASGQVDLELEHYQARLPGLEATGAATLRGQTDLHIGRGQVFFTGADATVSVQVDDARVAPGGQGFSLDAGQGSQLDLRVQELKVGADPSANSVVLGPGSRLQAVLDGGELTLGERRVSLEAGSQARFDIDRLARDGQGVPELRGALAIDARLRTADLEAARAVDGVQVERVQGARARARITVDDVVLGQDGRFRLDRVGVHVDGGVERIAGATGANGQGRGTLATTPRPAQAPLTLPAAVAEPGPASAPEGTLPRERVQALSAAAIAGAPVRGQDFNPASVARRVQDGQIEITIPVEGTLGSGWRSSADFPRGTTLTVQATVENGRIVPGQTRARFSQSGDGPLWVTVRGAYFDDENTLRLDLGGMRDFAVPGMARVPLDVEGFVDRVTGSGARRAGGAGTGRARATNPGPAVPAALHLAEASVRVENARFRPGPLSLPGGVIDVAADTRLSLSGTPQAATLSGRVRFDELELAQDGVALHAGQGSADLRVDYRREGAQAVVETRLDDMNLDVRYAVHTRRNGDYLHLADGLAEGGALRTTTRLALGADGLPRAVTSAEVNLEVPRFAGRIEGARVTVDDADGEAQIEFGRSRVEGQIRVDRNQIAVKGRVDQLDAAVRDFAVQSGQGQVDVQYARLRGQGQVEFAQGRGLVLDAEVQDVDARLRDVQARGRGMTFDAGRTLIRGDGRVRLNSTGEVLLDGDLHVDSSLDRVAFAGETVGARGQVETTAGSRLVADVEAVRFTRDGAFTVRGHGGVDLGVREFSGAVPGMQVEGSARVRGGGRFELDSREGIKLPDRLQVDVDVRDGALRSRDGHTALDLAAGSRVSLHVDDVRVQDRGRSTLVTLGPGTRVQGALDGGQLGLPGIAAPLDLAAGSHVDFTVDEMVLDARGARRARGRLRLEAELRTDQLDLEALAGIRGLQVQRLDGARVRLQVDVPQAQLTDDGRFVLDGTTFSLEARLGAVTGRYTPRD